MTEQILAKLKEEKFVEKLFACESIEQVQELFKDSGVEITKEEAQEVIDGMVMLSQKMLSLSEEELEACSGGRIGETAGNIARSVSQKITNGVNQANGFVADNAEFVAGAILAIGVYKAGKYVYNAVKAGSKSIIGLAALKVADAVSSPFARFYGKR